MRTLLVNLTRFGDLLQTQPAVGGLVRAGDAVGVLCLENFARTAGLLPDVSFLQPLPGARLLGLLDQDWRMAAGELRRWAKATVEAFEPDRVINLTPTLASRLLARAVADAAPSSRRPPVEGFALDAYGFGQDANPWAVFLQSSSLRARGCSPFNVCDLFWQTAGLGGQERRFALRAPSTEELQAADVLLGKPGSGGFVGLQLGASEDRRRWPVAHFAALGKMLAERAGVTPVVLGAPNETELAERYFSAGGPGISLAGKTSLGELAAAVSRLRLLVSNDTGTMHLAAGLAVPVLGIFLATAQPWDTGPYREKACSLEPNLDCHPCPFGQPCPHNHACRAHIPPQLLADMATAWLTSGGWPAQRAPSARVWLAEREPNGFMGLRSLSGCEGDDRTVWVRLQREFYRRFLDREPPPDDCLQLTERLSAAAAAHARQELQDAFGLLTLLEEQAKLLAVAPRDALKAKFLDVWRRVQQGWSHSAYFSVLGHMWLTESQHAGEDLPSLQRVIARYKHLAGAWLSFLS